MNERAEQVTDEVPRVIADPQELRRSLAGVQDRLEKLVERNPEHVVDGPAVQMVSTIAANAALRFDDHPILRQVAAGRFDAGTAARPIRAADLLIVVEILRHSLPG